MSVLTGQPQNVLDYFMAKRARILVKTRLGNMDSMIPNPTDEELNLAILDSIDALNLIKPISGLTPLDVTTSSITNVNLDYLVYVGGCYKIMETIWNDWGHSGDEISLSVLSEPDRMARFEEMLNKFKEEFEELAKDYKYNANFRISSVNYRSTSRVIDFGRSNSGRKGFKSAFRKAR